MKRFTESEPENRDGIAKRIGKIYGEAAKIQDRFSMRWGLDQNDLQHMDELQEQLISEIHDIAPERAKNLRTMLDRLNFNHLACLIQISDRTRWLVFNEFMRRVREILNDC